MNLTFLGATHEVTGSYTLLEWLPGRFLLIDYGMKQGEDEYINEPIPVKPSQIEYILLTHAHIDHSGNIPLLVKQGFRGTIYCTAETVNLCHIMLADSAHIQESEAMSQNKKNVRAGLPEIEPLYTKEDAEAAMNLFQACQYNVIYQIDEGLQIRFIDIGHLLGSAAIECFLEESGVQKKIVFSGDVGNLNQPILNDPQFIQEADYLMIESTYGNRLHDEKITDHRDAVRFLTDVLRRTFARGGSVIIPSFAVGRTQELLYFFREIKQEDLLPEFRDFPVYVDSPMSNEATAVFLQCDISCLDEDFRNIMQQGVNPIWFDGLHTVTETEESKRLNDNKDIKVIISSGGMCEGGRIRHHLKHNLWDERNTVLFVGYQSNGTLGRILYDGAKSVKIYGETIEVKAEITLLHGVSGHADQKGLLRWISGFVTKPKYVFVNHGDDEACEALCAKITADCKLPAMAPWSGSSFDLLKGEWIRLKEPVVRNKTKKAGARIEKKQDKASLLYDDLLDAAEQLLDAAKNMKGHSNQEIAQWTKKIREIMKE